MPSVTYSSSKPSAPESITILTSGNYTVPAGKSAKISAICNGSATVSLNGTQVLNGATWDAMRSNISPQIMEAYQYSTFIGGFWSEYRGRALNAFSGSNLNSLKVSGNTGSAMSVLPITSVVGDAFTNNTAQSALSASYTVPAGTVVGTSGGRCVIEIYSA